MRLIGLTLSMLLASCTELNQYHADVVSHSARLEKATVTINDFILTTYSRIGDPNQPINVYIEGDGLAWVSRHQLSSDPTPKQAIGLELAARDPSKNVAYLARPCQFNDFNRTPCDSAYWSNLRFSERAIDAMNQSLDSIVKKTNNQKVNLIGYSGGAAVAVLISQRRHDILSLRTVAGNLDHAYVNQYHHVDSMPESLNAIDVAAHITDIPQLHFIGTHDKIIPKEVASRFTDKQSNSKCITVIQVDADHQNNWIEQWTSLLKTPFSCVR